MPGSTPNRAYPYPLAGESPAGHTQMQSLATAIDTDVANMGKWVAYTPTLSGALTLGNGTVTGAWTRLGDLVVGAARATLGSTSVMGSGYVQFSAPVDTNASTVFSSMSGAAYDTSASQLAILVSALLDDPTSIRCYLWPDANGLVRLFTSTVPFTWAAGDQVQAQFVYRRA